MFSKPLIDYSSLDMLDSPLSARFRVTCSALLRPSLADPILFSLLLSDLTPSRELFSLADLEDNLLTPFANLLFFTAFRRAKKLGSFERARSVLMTGIASLDFPSGSSSRKDRQLLFKLYCPILSSLECSLI